MKKILIFLFASIIFTTTAFAVDKNSAEYLRNKKHISPVSPLVQGVVQNEIKKALKKETGADFKVKFKAYNVSSLKAGVFKYLEIIGQDITVENIFLPYVKVYSITDYNRIDYTKDPIEMKSDMVYAYELNLSEKSINDALQLEEYQKTIQKVNQKAYPLFMLGDVKVRIKNNRVHIIMSYNFPINPLSKNKTFFVSSDFSVEDGVIKAKNIGLDKAYGNLSLEKVTNLVNLIDPLSFTLDMMNSQKCQGKTENIKIVDNIFQINGKIYVKGE